MRYLVKAKVRDGKAGELRERISAETLGSGSVAFGEYVKNMRHARRTEDGTVCWVEVCFCAVPLQEERPYWERYFENIRTENAHDPKNCQDANGKCSRACLECRCTAQLEKEMEGWGGPFLDWLEVQDG